MKIKYLSFMKIYLKMSSKCPNFVSASVLREFRIYMLFRLQKAHNSNITDWCKYTSIIIITFQTVACSLFEAKALITSCQTYAWDWTVVALE